MTDHDIQRLIAALEQIAKKLSNIEYEIRQIRNK